jgi:vitamin B12 transporter
VLCIVLSVSISGVAQQTDTVNQLETVVISATKFPVKKEMSGKLIYKIDSISLVHARSLSVLEVIDRLTTVHIHDSNSAMGKNKGVYIRGGRDRQVLVLIDGIAVSDPSGIVSTYDLRLLDLNQIASIEIMNGAASTLYGSGAATGVINIVTKKPGDKLLGGGISVAFGSNNDQQSDKFNFNTSSQRLSLDGSAGSFSYSGGFTHQNTDGLSEARSSSDVDYEEDDWDSWNAHVKLRYDSDNKWHVLAYAHSDRNKFDFDAGAFSDSDRNSADTEQFRYGFLAAHRYGKGILSFKASHNTIDRSFVSYNPWSDAMDRYAYTGETLVMELLNTVQFNKTIRLVTGLNYQRLQNDTNTPFGSIDGSLAHYNTIDPYAHITLTFESGFNMNVGGRLNRHSTYGSHWVYTINPSYNFNEQWRLLGSWSTAFITPSTYQLFSQYGNTALEPEEDRSAELGIDFQSKDAFSLSVVYFDREEQNAIQLPDFVQYINKEGALKVKGIETTMEVDLFNYEVLGLSHSYADKSGDHDYIPKHKVTVNASSRRLKNSFIALNFSYVSERTYLDHWGTGETIRLAPYRLMDLYGSHDFNGTKMTAYMNLQNIWNEDYESTHGFSTRGRTFKLGITYRF